MARLLTAGFTLAALISLSAQALAQEKCPEGRAFSGKCANPALSAGVRQNSIIYSQPKISETAFPILPEGDFQYRYPHSLIPNPLKPAPAFSPSP